MRTPAEVELDRHPRGRKTMNTHRCLLPWIMVTVRVSVKIIVKKR